MKQKIKLVIALMSLCTFFLLGLQLYWNYESYQNSTRIFKSNINYALEKAVERVIDIKQDKFVLQYKKWLADTNLIIINCHYSDTSRSTIFTIEDKYPPYPNKLPFSMGISQFEKRLDKVTPSTKLFFIEHFTKSTIANDVRSGSAYFYTQRLGELLGTAYHQDHLDKMLLNQLFKEELLKRDINSSFVFKYKTYAFENSGAVSESIRKNSYITRRFKYGFSFPLTLISAYFTDSNLFFLQKMKWVLFGSLVLVSITIFCFTYTIKTMLSQDKLAALKDNFVNNMTHELKTPVSTISIAAEAIQNFSLSGPATEEYLNIIRYQANSLSYLIDQILKSMVSEHSGLILNREKINVSKLLENCIRQYIPQFEARKVNFSYDIFPKSIQVTGDQVHLSNVIANLLDNAIKYSGEQPVIHLQAYLQNKKAVIIIKDNGMGIPNEYQDRVFDRFFRVPAGNIHNVKGYGLGLSYARDIIRQHGGELTLSVANSATTFTINLPLYFL